MTKRTRLMGIWLAATGSALMLAAGAVLAEGDSDQLTIHSGVYTEEQAERGSTPYGRDCAVCHGGAARGGPDAPGLIGHTFNVVYNGQPLSAYFETMRTTMPFGRPNSLSAQAYTDIIAYLLSRHGAPAGDTELPADAEELAEILIVPAPD